MEKKLYNTVRYGCVRVSVCGGCFCVYCKGLFLPFVILFLLVSFSLSYFFRHRH
jgi:hypothetical protein